MLVCDKCNAGIGEGSKFCPQCGDPVTEEDRVSALVVEQQVANVEITFGQSTSSNFNKAVDICEKIPSYSVDGEGKHAIHKISLPITEAELITNLFDLVGSWKSSKMLINGHNATKKDLTYYGVGCYRSRQKAYQPEQFCFGEREHEANIWGCKRLNMPINEWGVGWLNHGRFDESGVWYFDKDRIKHELEIAIKEIELCPLINRKRIFETLDKLPASINPKTDSNWDYRTSYEEVNGEYKEVAVGVKPVIKKINRYIIGDFKPTWESAENGVGYNNDRTIKIDLQTEVKKADKKTKGKNKKGSSVFWWFIGAALVLYFLFM